jgi:hypothetical protein
LRRKAAATLMTMNPKTVMRSARVDKRNGDVVAGETKKYVPAAADRSVPSTAAPNPPYHAVNITTRKYTANGIAAPTSGVRAMRRRVANTVNPTAQAY